MPSITLGQILSRVYARIDGNTLLYPRADCVQEINDAVQVCNLLTGSIQSTTQIWTGQVDPTQDPPLMPQLVYPTPPGIIFITSVVYEGRELTPMSLRALAGQYRSWATDVSSPQGRPVKEFSPIGWDKFVIHPADGQGGRSLLITGVTEPTPMVLDTDLFPLPNEFSEDVEDLVGSVLPIREGGMIAKTAAAELYSAFIVRMKLKSSFTNLTWPTYYQRLAGWKPSTPSGARIPNAGQ